MVKVTSTMVANARMKAKQLQRKFGNDPNNIPSNVIAREFNPKSLEHAPENW